MFVHPPNAPPSTLARYWTKPDVRVAGFRHDRTTLLCVGSAAGSKSGAKPVSSSSIVTRAESTITPSLVEVPERMTCRSPVFVSSFTAAMVTVPVLVVAPAANESVVPALSE